MSTIVTVNKEPIESKDLDTAVARYLAQISEDTETDFEASNDNIKYIRTEVLNFLIERVLLLQLAKTKDIATTDDVIESKISDIKSGYNTEEWQSSLKQMKIQEDDLFNEIRNDIIMEQLLFAIYNENININDKTLLSYYNENENIMKNPDLFSFYELVMNTKEKVNLAVNIIADSDDIVQIKTRLKAQDIEFTNYTDLPAHQLPTNVINILADVEVGKIATMPSEDDRMVLFKLNNRIKGKKLDFNEIKNHLETSLRHKAQKEVYSQCVTDELDKANIEYIDISYLEQK